MYVFHETTYDSFHTNKDWIYRINLLDNDHSTGVSAITTAGIGPSLIEDFPEVEEMVRLSYPAEGDFTVNNINFNESAIMYADSSFFRTFSFSLLDGNPSMALNDPFDFSFLENRIELNYHDEAKIGQTIIYLTLISIIIACLGLYGQAAYSILQRTKEIGVRKILGANYKDILFTLSGRYARIIIFANLLS